MNVVIRKLLNQIELGLDYSALLLLSKVDLETYLVKSVPIVALLRFHFTVITIYINKKDNRICNVELRTQFSLIFIANKSKISKLIIEKHWCTCIFVFKLFEQIWCGSFIIYLQIYFLIYYLLDEKSFAPTSTCFICSWNVWLNLRVHLFCVAALVL